MTPVPDRSPIRIVLTGGPGAGKTSIVSALTASPAWHAWRDTVGGVEAVSEAATSVYGRRGVRWDTIDDDARRDVQREIYRHQLEQEAAADEAATKAGARLVLLDRGTVDGSAYWPGGPVDYWHAVDSSPADEFARYDAVVLLETAATLGHYDGDASNAVRFESSDAAIESGKLLAQLWGHHPLTRHLPASQTFAQKLHEAATLITQLVGASA